MTAVFDSAAYLTLEAERQGGVPQLLDVGATTPVGVIRRTAPDLGVEDGVSVYGYPHFPRTADAADFRDGLSALQQAGNAAGLLSIYLRLQPEVLAPPDAPAGVACVEVGNVVAVDLTERWVDLFGAYRAQLRYDVRKFGDLYDVERSAAKSNEFAQLYFQNMDRVGATAGYYFPVEYFTALADMDGVTYWFLRTADGELAAAALVIDEGDTLYYHLGASHPDHARRASMKVLLSRIIEHHADRHWRQLILGGGVGGQDDSLLRFKRGFSSLERRVFAVRMICDLDRYRQVCGTTDPTVGYFPAYRAAG